MSSYFIYNDNLQIWQIVAFYMYETDSNKYYKITEIKEALADIIKRKYPKAESSKYQSLLRDDMEGHLDVSITRDKPYIFSKNGRLWFLNEKGVEWVKNNIGELNSSQKEYEKPSAILNFSEEVKKKFQKEKFKKYKKIKNSIEKYIIENYNDVFLLGQIKINENYLKNYIKYCIETNHFAEHGDIVLVTAITKIVQKYSTASNDVWQCLLKTLKLKKIEEEITIKKIKHCYKITIDFFNKMNFNLFLDKDTKNPQNIKCHCYISNNNCIKYFDFLKSCYQEYKNCLNVNNIKIKISQSNVSKHIINIIKYTDIEKLESLLSRQIECIKQFYSNEEHLVSSDVTKDYIANELYKYLSDAQNYKESLNQVTNATNIKKSPEYEYTNGKIQILLPCDLYCKVSLEIFSEEKLLKKTNNMYVCNDAPLIELNEENEKFIFEDIKIKLVTEDGSIAETLSLKGKKFRFFDRTGKESLLSSINKGLYAYLITDKTLLIKEEKGFIDYIKEKSAYKSYNLYRIDLINRNKYIVIDGIKYYLSKNTPKDIEIEQEYIKYLENNDIDYRTKLPKIIIKDNGSMQENAYIDIVNINNNESLRLYKNDFSNLYRDENNDEFLVFDLSKNLKDEEVFKYNNIYEVKYTNKNQIITKKFLLIGDLDIKFEKELYTDEKEIFFTTNKELEFINANLISKIDNRYKYKYIIQSSEDPNINNPIIYEISSKEKTYSFIIKIPFLLFSTNNYRQEKIIEENEYFVENRLNDIKISFPSGISLSEDPKIKITDLNTEKETSHIITEYNNSKYIINIIKDFQEKPYKKSLELKFKTQFSDYSKKLGVLINYPVFYTNNFYINDKKNIKIEIKYENIPNYPKLYREIKEISEKNNKIFLKEKEIAFDYEEEIEKTELVRDKEYKLKIYKKQLDTRILIFEKSIKYSPTTKEYPDLKIEKYSNDNKNEFNFFITYKPLDAKIFLYIKEENNILLSEDDYRVFNGENSVLLPKGLKFNTNYEFSFWVCRDMEYEQISFTYNGQNVSTINDYIETFDIKTINIKEINRGKDKEFYELKKDSYYLKDILYNNELGLYEGCFIFKHGKDKQEKVILKKIFFTIKALEYGKYKIIIDRIHNNNISLVYFEYIKKYENGNKFKQWRFTTSTDDTVQDNPYKEQIIKNYFISEMNCVKII